MSWSHQFDEDVAKEYGVSPAVMIASIQRWIRRNRANEKHRHDDRTWTYNSWRSWAELFPFWTADQVRRILEKLIELKVLRVGNFNKTGFDRTTWYAFEDEERWVPFGKSAESHSAKMPNGNGEKAEPIPPSSTSLHPDTLRPPAAPALPALFRASELGPRADPKPKKRPKASEHVLIESRIIDYYQKLYMEDHAGAKPNWGAKERLLVRGDLSRMGWDDERLAALIEDFFDEPGEFVERKGAGMGYNVFHSQIDALLERESKRERRAR
jgi:hypothetical protein